MENIWDNSTIWVSPSFGFEEDKRQGLILSACAAIVCFSLAGSIAHKLKQERDAECKHSSPFFFPFFDLLLIIKYGTFPEFVKNRKRQLRCDNFFVRLPFQRHETLLITKPEDHAALMSKEGKLKLLVEIPDTVTMLHGPGNMQNIAGEQHKFIRKIFSGLLSPRALESFVPHIVTQFHSMWNDIQEQSRHGEVKIEEQIREAQFYLMCKIFFGMTPDSPEDKADLARLNEDFELEVEALFANSKSQKFKKGLDAANRSRAYLSDRFRKVLDSRRNLLVRRGGKGGNDKPSPVGNAMDAIADTLLNDGIDDDPQVLAAIDDNMLLLLEASHATTMTVTTSTMYFLTHPGNERVLDKVREEVRNIGEPTLAKVKGEMTYSEACIKEAMRLAPIIGGVMYRMDEGKSIEFRGRRLAGPMIFFMEFSHWYRDAGLFPSPEIYKPERWLPGNDEVGARAKMAYKPFGMGRHMCLGNQLAMIVMKASLYCFASDSKRVIEYNVDTTKIAPGLFPQNSISGGLLGRVISLE